MIADCTGTGRSKDVEEANARLCRAAPSLWNGCHALLGLVQLLLARDDLPIEVREALTSSHRIMEAEVAVAMV